MRYLTFGMRVWWTSFFFESWPMDFITRRARIYQLGSPRMPLSRLNVSHISIGRHIFIPKSCQKYSRIEMLKCAQSLSIEYVYSAKRMIWVSMSTHWLERDVWVRAHSAPERNVKCRRNSVRWIDSMLVQVHHSNGTRWRVSKDGGRPWQSNLWMANSGNRTKVQATHL